MYTCTIIHVRVFVVIYIICPIVYINFPRECSILFKILPCHQLNLFFKILALWWEECRNLRAQGGPTCPYTSVPRTALSPVCGWKTTSSLLPTNSKQQWVREDGERETEISSDLYCNFLTSLKLCVCVCVWMQVYRYIQEHQHGCHGSVTMASILLQLCRCTVVL